MKAGLQRFAVLGIMMMFFAVLALDVVVPLMVLSLMAFSVWLVERLPDDLFDAPLRRGAGGETA
ncbi:hypothetical protein ACQ3G6_09175 [Allorhizobium undicola]|uniref:hypothetical protein n=1 Tax=Allorhizobium undicola TaxID=78527 RepID=UPI000561F208|nr:hypothetical protein [Allorhizobium undicola]